MVGQALDISLLDAVRSRGCERQVAKDLCWSSERLHNNLADEAVLDPSIVDSCKQVSGRLGLIEVGGIESGQSQKCIQGHVCMHCGVSLSGWLAGLSLYVNVKTGSTRLRYNATSRDIEEDYIWFISRMAYSQCAVYAVTIKSFPNVIGPFVSVRSILR